MRIFFICQRVPFPPDRGDKITTYNEIRHLSQRHEMHVFCLADGKQDLANVSGLRDYTTSITAVPIHHVRSRIRALRALPLGQPLSVAALCEPLLHAAIRRSFAELKPDMVMVYSSNVAQFAEPFARAPRIMQFADLDSLKWLDYARRSRPPMRWIYALEARRLLEYERRIARTFSRSLVCTEMEARDFCSLVPYAPVNIVRNGVDLQYFRSTGSAKESASIVFSGVMNYAPNVDAVRWFCAKIFPIVRKHVPHATLTICGANPTAAVQRLGRRPGVIVTGRVADVRPYLDRAELFIAPLRLARGIQNKVLEAMAMSLPVVASRAVWHATALPDGAGITVADGIHDFVAKIVHLLQDTTYRIEMGRSARASMERDYSWAAQLTVLDQVIEDVMAKPG